MTDKICKNCVHSERKEGGDQYWYDCNRDIITKKNVNLVTGYSWNDTSNRRECSKERAVISGDSRWCGVEGKHYVEATRLQKFLKFFGVRTISRGPG